MKDYLENKFILILYIKTNVDSHKAVCMGLYQDHRVSKPVFQEVECRLIIHVHTYISVILNLGAGYLYIFHIAAHQRNRIA